MEKKYYNSPEAKFHQLKTTEMIADSNKQGDDNEDPGAKGFGSFTFDEDED
jgi:hypothetical protein